MRLTRKAAAILCRAMLQRTPLYPAHQRLGANFVPFAGWEMPLQYSGIVDEHLAVRQAAGLFDISHMGKVRVLGAAARDFLNSVLTNDLRKLAAGQGQYTLLCNPQGGVVDDLYAYCLAAREFLLIVNAARTAADVAWLRQQLAQFPHRGDVELEDASAFLSAVAVQGPRVAEFIDACVPGPATGGRLVAKASELKKNQVAGFRWHEALIWVARTGYTGEDGFEIVAPNGVIAGLWDTVLANGQAHGLKPCGLGARDTLRTEMGYPLYGHELDEQTTPIEAGLGAFVALDKGDFTGRSVLAAQKVGGVNKKCVAFKLAEKGALPRPGCAIWAPDRSDPIGRVTSGTHSPCLGVGIGLGYVAPEFANPGTALSIEVRGRRVTALVVPKPIYRRPTPSAGQPTALP
jgi:aminomethyltransferase